MTITIPHIDLAAWYQGADSERRELAEQVDNTLREVGFFNLDGHGVPGKLRADLRSAAAQFFALPPEIKQRYAVSMGGRGWLPSGAVTAGYSEGTATPPDLKETYSVGADNPTGDPRTDQVWFKPNVYPDEVRDLESLLTDYLTRMRRLATDLLRLCALALRQDVDFFTRHADHPTYTMNLNWYPALARLAPPQPGQFRIGPHTDFGTVTVLDRQDGVGGLQVHTRDGEWVKLPYDPDSFVVNIGDLLARWSGDRWRSSRHRVLPPDPSAPDEELLSLIFFYVANPGATVESLPPPIGVRRHEPIRAEDYLMQQIRKVDRSHHD